jgi:hypothetical protein
VLSLYQASQRERAAAAAVQRLPATVVKAIKETSRDYAVDAMMRAARARAGSSSVRQRLAGSGRLSFYRGTPGVSFGGMRSVTSTGMSGRVAARPAEFGSPGTRFVNVSTRSPKGRTFVARRRTSRQWMPQTPAGKFVTPAAEAIADDVIARWVDDVESATIAALDEGA